MATKNDILILREDWSAIFNTLKTAAPSLFGSKVFTDVKFMGADPEDINSKMMIEFKET